MKKGLLRFYPFLCILSVSANASHSVEGQWKISNILCERDYVPYECKFDWDLLTIEMMSESKEHPKTLNVTKIDLESSSTVKFPLFDFNYSGNGAKHYANLWEDASSLRWREFYEDSLEKSIERVDIYTEESVLKYHESRYMHDRIRDESETVDVFYFLVKP